LKIGVMVESFKAGLEGGLAAAAKIGADGVQMYATEGPTHPDALNASARADLRRRIADMGLEFSAICGDFGGHGFQIAEDNPARIEDSRKVMDLALDLGCNVVTTHIGVVPAEKSHPRYGVMAAACEELGRYGESAGATFAIETGPETALDLRAFLDDISLPKGIGVNLDPANLVMVVGDDPVEAVCTLKDYIVHTHAKDGVRLAPCDPVEVYNAFAVGGVEGFDFGKYFNEVPLGSGAVDWDNYLKAFKEIGFEGFLTVEREVGDNPREDVEQAVRFLRKLLA
jgi:sugar phosphate isomerase/epimerase